MGIDKVSHAFRPLDRYYGIQYRDVAEMRIHHKNNPAKNYCLVELSIPAISRMFTGAMIDGIESSLLAPSLHGLRFLQATSGEFYKMIRHERPDKVRRVDGDDVFTYYFSGKRKVRYYLHDYAMSALLYLNHPKRGYTRRTPCAKIDPQCIKCFEYLQEPVLNYLDNSDDSLNAHFDDYFFSKIEENHTLLMGYTVEKKKTVGECFTTSTPEYFVQDMSQRYFYDTFDTNAKFKVGVVDDRKSESKDMILLVDRKEITDIQYETYEGGGGYSGARLYNSESMPSDLATALANKSFDELWKFDFLNLNVRNTIHKFQYNHWAFYCTHADDGFYCSWDVSETIDNAASPGNASDTAKVKGQLNQVANMFGWGRTGDTSSSDTVFTLIAEKIDGINYDDVLEPIGEVSSLF